MKKQKKSIYSRYLTSLVIALTLLVFGGSYLYSPSADAQKIQKMPEENLILGKLAFIRFFAGPTTPDNRIYLVNPDGSDESSLPVSTSLRPSEPAWSSDGTQIAFAQLINDGDIYKTSIDGTSGVINLTNTAAPILERNPTWSSTGKIAYERESKIWVMDDDGSGQVQFPGITENAEDPSWSPDGSKLAYITGGDLWVINADGTNKQEIANGSVNYAEPSWSPDNLKIVFKGNGGIAVINADGTNQQNITNNGNDNQPSWAPDGTKIAFDRDGVYVMNPDGSNQIRIVADIIRFPTCCDVINEHPTWQPVSQQQGTYTISGRVTRNNVGVAGAFVNLTGSARSTVTTNAVGDYQFTGLAAGGSYIVSPSIERHYFMPASHLVFSLLSNEVANFEVDKVCQGGECVRNGKIAFQRSGLLYIINPDGTGEVNIDNNGIVSRSAMDWSPDGSKIVFETNRDGNNEIYTMNADGSNQTRLTNNTSVDRNPQYSPDGTKIVFASNRDGDLDIYQMDADGSNPTDLSNNDIYEDFPAYSNDGKQIIYYRLGATDRKLYTMNTDGTNKQPLSSETNTFQSYEHSEYSPDGSKIIYTYIPSAGASHPEIRTMNSDGTGVVEYGFGRSGVYSPDGTQRMYVCCDFEPNIHPARIRIVDQITTAERVISAPNSQIGSVAWQQIKLPHPAPFDFDGDARSDLAVYRPSEGNWYQFNSTDGYEVKQWGLADDVLVPADYDGDQATDLAVWRPSSGDFYIINSFTNTFRVENLGLAGDIPTGGDWDGDGKADPAVYRDGSQSVFYYRGSMANPQENITSVPWGIAGDKPVAADYDGDGKTDAAIYRDNIWYVLQSSDSQLSATYFGLPDDVLTPADYDGDGKTDQAVYREGVWYLLQSTNGFAVYQFGIADDIPIPADYDGDGNDDIAVYRDGIWWILNSQSGSVNAFSFGLDTDLPIPAAYVR